MLAGMLEEVVREDGTAARAAIPGYRVAGKTGTVRKVGAEGYDDERIRLVRGLRACDGAAYRRGRAGQ